MKIYFKVGLATLMLLATSFLAYGMVPGDLDGDQIISQDDLQKAETSYKDGVISSDSFDEIKHIHDNYPRTIEDAVGRTVTIYKPVERVITYGGYDAELMYILGDKDKIVAVPNWFMDSDFRRTYLTELKDKPNAGNGADPDYEALLQLDPDLIICWHYYPDKLDEQLPDNITIVALDLFNPETFLDEAKELAYILERDDEIDHYINGFYSKYINMIEGRTDTLSDDDRPSVYWERSKAYETFGKKPYITSLVEICGGKNIFAEDDFDISMTDPESVIKKNPDIIIRYASSKGPETGYSVYDPKDAKALRDEVLGRSELASVNAVINDRVYIMNMGLPLGIQGPIGAIYAAKIIHPDLFKDVDPNAVTKELVTEFLGTSYDSDASAVLVYPMDAVS